MARDEAPSVVNVGEAQVAALVKRGYHSEVPRLQFAAGTVRNYAEAARQMEAAVEAVTAAVIDAGETFYGEPSVEVKHLLLEAEGPMPEFSPSVARPWADSGLDVVRALAVSFRDPFGSEPGLVHQPSRSAHRQPKESHVLYRYRPR